MKLDIRPMKPEERLYIYQQSSQIEGQTGSIGRLRGDFGKSGTEFYTTWEDYIKKFRSDDFDDEFDKVINAMRSVWKPQFHAAFLQGKPGQRLSGKLLRGIRIPYRQRAAQLPDTL